MLRSGSKIWQGEKVKGKENAFYILHLCACNHSHAKHVTARARFSLST
jgi:hypothetical protein